MLSVQRKYFVSIHQVGKYLQNHEPPHGKINNLHKRKQMRRSASEEKHDFVMLGWADYSVLAK